MFLEEVMASHQETVLELKKYYTDITDANLKEITQLKVQNQLILLKHM